MTFSSSLGNSIWKDSKMILTYWFSLLMRFCVSTYKLRLACYFSFHLQCLLKGAGAQLINKLVRLFLQLIVTEDSPKLNDQGSVACWGEVTWELLPHDCSVCHIGSIFQGCNTTPKHSLLFFFLKKKGSPIQDLPVCTHVV